MIEEVILVNEDDIEVGVMEKMEAHRKGLLHRAFSVFVFNSKGELLLQQRAFSKYHSPGLWTNTCCSHPRKGESVEESAHRRLREEMGIQCELSILGHFLYKAELDKGLTEHEYDYILKGVSDELPEINPGEVQDYKYISIDNLKDEVIFNPGNYTFWLKEVLQRNFF